MFLNYIFARGLKVLCCPNWGLYVRGLYVRGLFDLDSQMLPCPTNSRHGSHFQASFYDLTRPFDLFPKKEYIIIILLIRFIFIFRNAPMKRINDEHNYFRQRSCVVL